MTYKQRALRLADEHNLGDITADGKLISCVREGQDITHRLMGFVKELRASQEDQIYARSIPARPSLASAPTITQRMQEDAGHRNKYTTLDTEQTKRLIAAKPAAVTPK
jgi:hypothetical protein